MDRTRLHLQDIQVKDEGFYLCAASNSAGSAERLFELVVLGTDWELQKECPKNSIKIANNFHSNSIKLLKN